MTFLILLFCVTWKETLVPLRSLWDEKEEGRSTCFTKGREILTIGLGGLERVGSQLMASFCHFFSTEVGTTLITTNIQIGASWESTGAGRGSDDSSMGLLKSFINSPNTLEVIIMRILKASVEEENCLNMLILSLC